MNTQNNSAECFLRCSLSRLAVFGDGKNEIPMFETVGYSVIMGNAINDVKLYEDYITKSNNEDGVVYAIENSIKKI